MEPAILDNRDDPRQNNGGLNSRDTFAARSA